MPTKSKTAKSTKKQKDKPEKVLYGARKVFKEACDTKAAAAIKDLLTPMEYLLSIVNDPVKGDRLKIEAARSLLPYCHKKLPVVTEISGRDGKAIEIQHTEARNKLEEFLLSEGATDEYGETRRDH